MVTGESTKETVKTIAQGMPVDPVYLWWLPSAFFTQLHAAMGATRIRHSLRPLYNFEGGSLEQLGRFQPRERELMCSAVMLRACGASSTPRSLGSITGVSRTLDRSDKPGDDSGERGRFRA